MRERERQRETKKYEVYRERDRVIYIYIYRRTIIKDMKGRGREWKENERRKDRLDRRLYALCRTYL